MAHLINLPLSLTNLHDIFHVSQLRKYIMDPSHVIQMDNVQVRYNLTLVASLVQIKGWKVKQLWGKDISLVKVMWGGSAGESLTRECEDQI